MYYVIYNDFDENEMKRDTIKGGEGEKRNI